MNKRGLDRHLFGRDHPVDSWGLELKEKVDGGR